MAIRLFIGIMFAVLPDTLFIILSVCFIIFIIMLVINLIIFFFCLFINVIMSMTAATLLSQHQLGCSKEELKDLDTKR